MRGRPIPALPPEPEFDDETLRALVVAHVKKFGSRRTAALLGIGEFACVRIAGGLDCRIGTRTAAMSRAHLLEGAGVSFESRSGGR